MPLTVTIIKHKYKSTYCFEITHICKLAHTDTRGQIHTLTHVKVDMKLFLRVCILKFLFKIRNQNKIIKQFYYCISVHITIQLQL